MGFQWRMLPDNFRYCLAAVASAVMIVAGIAMLVAGDGCDANSKCFCSQKNYERRLDVLESYAAEAVAENDARIKEIERRLDVLEQKSMAEDAAHPSVPCAVCRAHLRNSACGFRFIACDWTIPCVFTYYLCAGCAGESLDAGNEKGSNR